MCAESILQFCLCLVVFCLRAFFVVSAVQVESISIWLNSSGDLVYVLDERFFNCIQLSLRWNDSALINSYLNSLLRIRWQQQNIMRKAVAIAIAKMQKFVLLIRICLYRTTEEHPSLSQNICKRLVL